MSPINTSPAPMLRAWGVPVTFAGAPAGTTGIWDEAGTVVLDQDGRAGVAAVEKTLGVDRAVADLLNEGDTLTVAGTTYTLREKPSMDDGELAWLYLRGG